MATEVPGNVSAFWRSLGFSSCNGSALGYPTICSFDGVWKRKALAAEVPLTTEVSWGSRTTVVSLGAAVGSVSAAAVLRQTVVPLNAF